MRSVSTSNVIAGNLAFQQAATHSADAGVETAVAFLEANSAGTTAALEHPRAAARYVAEPQDPAAGQSWDTFWTDACGIRRGQHAAGRRSGQHVSYVIHRLCNATGAPAYPGCSSSPTDIGSTGNSQGAGVIQLHIDAPGLLPHHGARGRTAQHPELCASRRRHLNAANRPGGIMKTSVLPPQAAPRRARGSPLRWRWPRRWPRRRSAAPMSDRSGSGAADHLVASDGQAEPDVHSRRLGIDGLVAHARHGRRTSGAMAAGTAKFGFVSRSATACTTTRPCITPTGRSPRAARAQLLPQSELHDRLDQRLRHERRHGEPEHGLPRLDSATVLNTPLTVSHAPPSRPTTTSTPAANRGARTYLDTRSHVLHQCNTSLE